jgi:phosphate starvation-inducible protein PhoH
MFHDFFNGQHICAHGSAGTGKSFVAIFLALNELFRNEDINKIIIVRSAVPTRDMGFMPGTLEEKEMHYELPYQEMFAYFLGRKSSYQDMKDAGIVKFCTTSYVRGVTWDNAVVIVDEGQNMTMSEIDSVITRLGENSRLIVCGDAQYQQDLTKRETSGFKEAISIMKRMPSFSIIEFTYHDIVRSEFVKSWIRARQDM